ncbi:MAG: TolC family protein [Pleomorphochaeta sp.]
MKKYLQLLLSILLTVAFPLVATSYPSLDVEYELENGDEIILEQESLNAFINQWQDDSILSFLDAEKELRIALLQENYDLEQLESLYRIQREQIQFQKREQGFKIGLSSQPLYSLSRSLNLTTTGSYDLSNTFGIGTTISKNLNTGAQATLSASQYSSLTLNSSSSSLWTWTHSPSVSLTLNQPLSIGDGLIDFSYANKELEKLEITATNSKLSYDQLLAALISQGNSQLSTLQSLKESRFILGEQLISEQASIKDAKKDLEEGLISRNSYESRVLNINQIRYSLSEVERQIETLEDSLTTLWGNSDYPKQVVVDSDLFQSLPSIIFNKEELVQILLENDYTYQQAINNLRSAEIDQILKNPSDAPIVSLSFQLSPYYVPTTGDGFFTSIDDLFTSSNPIFSLSIGFSASDFSRSATKLSSSLADESVIQARIEVEKARDNVETTVEEIQKNVKGLLINLSLAQFEFEQRANDIEVERIRFEIGLANESSIKAKELAWYDSAFTLLQILRELDLIALDLKASGVEL